VWTKSTFFVQFTVRDLKQGTGANRDPFPSGVEARGRIKYPRPLNEIALAFTNYRIATVKPRLRDSSRPGP